MFNSSAATLSGGNMENEKSTLTVLMVEPGKAPYQATIGADLKSLQQVVGGYIESNLYYSHSTHKNVHRT